MHKSAIFGLFLMASLLLGTSVNMNMFSSANAQGMGQNDNKVMNNQPMETIHMEVAAMIQVTVMIKVMTRVMTRVMTTRVMTNNYDNSHDKQSSYGPQQPSYDKPQNDYSTKLLQ